MFRWSYSAVRCRVRLSQIHGPKLQQHIQYTECQWYLHGTQLDLFASNVFEWLTPSDGNLCTADVYRAYRAHTLYSE